MTQQEAEVILKVNDKKAREKLEKLQAQAADLRQKFADAFRKGDTRGIDSINKELQKVDKQINNMRINAANIRAAMERLDQASPRELQRTIKLINNELNSGRVKRGTKEWDDYVEKLKQVQAELSKVKKEMQPDNSESFLEKVKDGINDWGASAAAATAAFAGVVMSGKAAVQAYADMEAEEANVRKFTGMTAEEVASLNEEFKKLDTRTSREELNKLAQEAGRLGKTKPEDVLGFVKAADQINVALDDLGEGATLTLSKLTGIFGDEARFGTEQSLLKVGSVINELSQNCSASAPYLAEFSSRIGGIAAQSKMTISQVMAFAAVLDSNNLAVEASSTAVGQLITSIYQEPAKIAKAAGMDVSKFSKMVKEDMNGALIALFEQLNRFGGMESLASVFDSMGTDGARAIPVLTALAGHVDTLKWQQSQANQAFREGISVTNEFNVQNNTVQAQLDKAKKGFNEMAVALGEQLLPVMRYCISGSSMMMRVISVLVDFIIKHKTAIISLTAGVAAYTIAVNLAAIKTAYLAAETKLFNAFMAAQRLVIIAATAVWSLLTGNIKKATAAFRLFSAAIKANPIGLAVSLITTAVVAIGSWIHKTNEAKKAEAELAKQREEQAREFRNQITDTSKKSADYAKGELDRLKKLYNATQDQTKSYNQRLAAVVELQKTYPTAFGNLSKEQILAGNAASAYNDLAKNIIKAARAKAAAEKIQENEKLILELEMENQTLNENIDYDAKMANLAKQGKREAENKAWTEGRNNVSGASQQTKAEIIANDNILKKYNARIDENSEKLETNRIKLDELNKANRQLAKTAADADKIVPDVKFDFGGPSAPSGNSPALPESDKERKEREKREREARKAESEAQQKAKEALKKDLDERKSLYLQAEAQNLTLYVTGQQSYADYLAKKKEQDQKYTDDVIKIHEDHNKLDIAEYGQALKSKADLLKKQQDEERKRSLTEVDSEHKTNTDEITSAYFDPSSADFQNKVLLNQKLLDEDLRYLQEKRDLYAEGSEEWAALDREYNERNRKDQLDKQKELFEAINQYKQEFGDAGRTAAYNAEIAMLDLLHKKGLIKEEEYQKNLEKIRSKFRTENMSESFKGFENVLSSLVEVFPEQMSGVSEQITGWLNGLSEEERTKVSEGFEKGFDNVIGITLVNGLSGILSMIDGFKDAAKGNWEGTIEDIGKMAENAANIIGGIMSTFSAYWNAQRDIEVAAIEKRYDKEIDAAGKNSKKKKKLEEQKEADIAKVKKKYNDRAMKMEIAQAIAQTAANAIGAYGAMVEIPVVGPALAAVAAAAAIAAGMIQVATIKKQHEAVSAGYYEGGFTAHDQNNRREVGVVHANEFVANHQAVANPALSPVLRLIDTAQRNNTVGSLTAADVSNALGQGSGVSARGVAATAGTDSVLRTGLAVMADNSIANNETMARLADALDEGIEAKVILDGEDGFHKKYKHFLKLQNNPKR